jgi:hypothetical protein
MRSGWKTLLVVVALLMGSAGACPAQQGRLAGSDWETVAVPRLGAQQASGLLVHVEADASGESRNALPVIVVAMARVAKWDILRVDVDPSADLEARHDEILGFLAERIAAARGEGYTQIVVSGLAQGASVALAASTLPGVDASIGLAPALATAGGGDFPSWAKLLQGARARRIAGFFFAGDPHDDSAERRAAGLRRALQDTKAAWLVIDRPTDLEGASAPRSGRFARRFRDCLLQFLSTVDPGPGEARCNTSSGYAIGADMRVPKFDAALRLPRHADPAFAAFWGRWEGDDTAGGYLIAEAIKAKPRSLSYRMAFSPPPLWQPPLVPGESIVDFELDGTGKRLFVKADTATLVTLRLLAPDVLEYDVLPLEAARERRSDERKLLRKRSDR